MKLKKSLDDFGIGEVKNLEPLSNSLQNTFKIQYVIRSFGYLMECFVAPCAACSHKEQHGTIGALY